ncbi:MAG: hypothetical protein RI945_185 [Candidatus Parcubacteria bacterium]|jgi:hypothetical protein
MNYKTKSSIWEDLREVLSHVNIKTYIYAILVLGVLFAIIINVKGESKYGHLTKDGKFTLDIENVARDYGLDINNENSTQSVDYANDADANLTFDLSQDLVMTNLFLQQNGITDTSARGKILADIITNYKRDLTADIYTDKDIKFLDVESELNLKEYYNQIVLSLADYTNKLDNIKEGDKDSIIALNEEIIKTLLDIPATKVGSEHQIKLINIFAKQNIFIKSTDELETDPIKYLALGGAEYTNNYTAEINNILDDLDKYFASLNIY